MSAKPFYNHIAGLRGLAILLVLLFHLNAEYFPHGYYGVDIFLTISGYLLFLSFSHSNHILNWKEFVTKKVLRIFPPMVILTLLVLLISIYLHDWEDILNTARAGRHTLFCTINNFLQRTQEDYFAASAIENPFLHMWYLAVTVQLYLIFATGAYIYRYLPGKALIVCIWLIGIASFCYSYSYQIQSIFQAIGLPTWEQAGPISHYYTFPRVWEMLAGGAILLLPNCKNKLTACILTSIGIIGAVLPALTPHSIANYAAPCVVLGTMLIIRYTPSGLLSPILSNKIILFVGTISFSLYLVHMPIIAFYHTWFQKISHWWEYGLIIGLSFALAYPFWLLVEKHRFHLATTITLWGIAMLLSVTGKSTEGYKDYIRKDINAIKVAPYDNWYPCEPNVLAENIHNEHLGYNGGVFTISPTSKPTPPPQTPLLRLGPASKSPSVVLMGDSHAASAFYGLNELCYDLNIPGAYLSVVVIPFWDKEHPGKSVYCFNQKRAEALISWLKANPEITHIIIAQHWRLRLESGDDFIHWDMRKEKNSPELLYNSLREFVLRLNKLDKHVILLGPCPELPVNSPTRHIRNATRRGKYPFDLSPITSTYEFSEKLNRPTIDFINKLRNEGLCSVLDAMSILAPDKPFCAYEDGKFLMRDDDHFTSEGSIRLFRHLKPQLEQFLRQQKPRKPGTL